MRNWYLEHDVVVEAAEMARRVPLMMLGLSGPGEQEACRWICAEEARALAGELVALADRVERRDR